MVAKRRLITLVSLTLTAGAMLIATGQTASGGTRGTALAHPIIGKPVAAPAKPAAGKRLSVSFKVTLGGTALTHGTLLASPSIGGKPIAHTQSLRGGTAQVSLLLPADSDGKSLILRVKVTSGGLSATRVATFAIPQGPLPQLEIEDASVTEGSAGTSVLAFPVTLSAPSRHTVTVTYATSNGSATSPGDYTPASGTLTFAPGETSKGIQVTVVGDTAFESDETLTVTLSSPAGATLFDTSATGRILNDDARLRPGKYSGPYSDGTYLKFETDAEGGAVYNLEWDFNGTCPGYGSSYGSWYTYGPYTIQPDGSFTANGQGTSSNNGTTITFSVTGKINSDGTASGTVNTDLVFTGGVHCTSTGTWNATQTG